MERRRGQKSKGKERKNMERIRREDHAGQEYGENAEVSDERRRGQK